ncbi:Ephrin [Necator americanus]|uniref:Ephrin n=1 Tax=Necator americanus TaxID=51031 RepID=W2TX71_NECAM|nr:Ephrin [Necator americanus]ETN86685.1 Ephrin [Necator americanus]
MAWMIYERRVERFAAIGDSLDIICPYYEPDIEPSSTEQSIIYRVSESDYETCTLSSTARELGRCISPMRRDKVKVSFRLLSPNPSALDYRPGHTYYFISTSTGTKRGLENRYGGLCASHQLKMVIHVTDKNGDISSHIHRIHRKPVTTTTTSTQAPADARWPSDPLWGEFFEKVGRGENPIQWATVTRGERVPLDGGNRRHEYEALALGDEVDFQIHEIGDVESLFSSGPARPSTALAVILLASILLTL